MSTYLIRLAFALLIVLASSHWASAQSNLRPSVSNPKNLREMGPASPIDDDCASAERFLQREYERQFPGSTFNADRIAADRRMGCENMKSKARLMGWKDANTRRRDALDREFDDRMAAQKAEWQNQWNDQQRQLQQIWSPQPIITLPRFPTELPPLRVPAQIFSPDWISTPDEPHSWDIPPDFEPFGAEQALNPSNHYFPGVDDQWHPDSVSPHAVPVPAKPTPINRPEHEAWHDLADRLLDTFGPEADARAWDALLNSPQQPANSNSPTSPWDALDAISASPSETYSPELVQPSTGSTSNNTPSMWDLLNDPPRNPPPSHDTIPLAERAKQMTGAVGLTGQSAPKIASDSVENVAEPTRSMFSNVIDRVWRGFESASGWIKGLADYFRASDQPSSVTDSQPPSPPTSEKSLR